MGSLEEPRGAWGSIGSIGEPRGTQGAQGSIGTQRKPGGTQEAKGSPWSPEETRKPWEPRGALVAGGAWGAREACGSPRDPGEP